MRSLQHLAWQMLLALLLKVSSAEYKFLNPFGNEKTVVMNEAGADYTMGSTAAGTVKTYANPTVLAGVRKMNSEVILTEWVNWVLAGREFAHTTTQAYSKYAIFATESNATVTLSVDQNLVHTEEVSVSTVLELDGLWIRKPVEIHSTADVLVAVATLYAHWMFVPLPPVANTIYGQCSRQCFIQVWGEDKDIDIERTCTNGSTALVKAGHFRDTTEDYSGTTCRWTAFNGQKISGASFHDGGGGDGTTFLPAEYFQLITPVPTEMHYLLIVSVEPAQCSVGDAHFTLTGFEGVYHAHRRNVDAAAVLECDKPVTAVGDAKCPTEFPHACNQKEVNLIVAPLIPTTTTTSSTSTGTTTTRTITTTTRSSTTASTTSTATTSSSTVSTTTSTVTATTTTATTSTKSTTSTTTTATATTTTVTATSSTTSTTTATTATTTTTRSTTSTTTTTTATTTTTRSTTSTSPTATTTTVTTASTTSTSSTATTASITTTTSSSTGSTTSTTSATATTSTATTSTSTTGTTATGSSTSTTATTVSATLSSTTGSTTTSISASTVSVTNTTATPSTTTSALTASVLVDRVEALEASLLAALAEGNLTRDTRQEDGLTIVAAKLDAAAVEAAGGNLTVATDNRDVSVTVQASIFSSLGEDSLVITIASVDLYIEAFTGNGSEPEVEVAAVVNVNLLSRRTGRHLDVAGLVDPVKVTMPVDHKAGGVECVYWDEDSSTWATHGVELASWDRGILECEATHLTLFAAVVRGFVNTFACSQVVLLNTESMKELAKGDWHRSIGALALWCLLSSFTLLMSLAAWLDWRRWMQGKRSDKHLLVPLQAQRQEERRNTSKVKAARRRRRLSCACAASCVVGSVLLLRQRVVAAVRALNERLEPFFRKGDVATDGWLGMLVRHLTSTVLVMSARRQVAASLGLSGGVSSLIMEDEDVFDVVMAHQSRELDLDELDPADTHLSPSGHQVNATSATLAREGVWGQLHQDVEGKVDIFMEAFARWSSLPCTIWLLFLYQNPFSMCFVHCAFTSCKQRVLLFIVRIVGSLMLTTVFFTAAGVPKKQGRSLDCKADDPFEIAGRIVATGTASILIAGIPALIFRSLCTRGLKKCDYEGGPKWNRQLKIWRRQDQAIWIMGVFYVLFCVFFVCLFLANVDKMDHGSWLLSGLLSIVQKTFLVPFAVALMLPLVATACLQFMSCHRRATKKELIGELRLQFKSRVNLNMTVGII